MRQGGCWCAGQAVKTSGWRARECTGSQATIGRERCWRQAGIPPASASVSKPLPTAKAPTFHPAFCRSNRRLACRVGERALCLVLPVAPSAVALPFVLLYAILRPTRFACAIAGRLLARHACDCKARAQQTKKPFCLACEHPAAWRVL